MNLSNTTLVDVGGHRLAITCAGSGNPTVVLDAGLAMASDAWQDVLPAVAQFTSVCSYDRAGLGRSEPATGPRNSQIAATELHTLLTRAGIAGPYVLVGHSFSGGTARLYVSQYSDEIVGMVLVDSAFLHGYDVLALLPPETAEEPTALHRARLLFQEAETHNDENMDLATSTTQVHTLAVQGHFPLVVLTRNPQQGIQDLEAYFPGFPHDVAEQLELAWQAGQRDLLRLSSRSTLMQATRSGHNIPRQEPELVIRAIHDVVDQTQAQ